MTARVWLHDSAGAWLNTVTDDDGALIADVAHAPGIFAPLNATLKFEGAIERGESLTTIRPAWWTVLEDVSEEVISAAGRVSAAYVGG